MYKVNFYKHNERALLLQQWVSIAKKNQESQVRVQSKSNVIFIDNTAGEISHLFSNEISQKR